MSGVDVSIIDKKFQLLIKRMKYAKEENQKLLQQLQVKQEEINRQQETLSEMEHKMKLLKLTTSSNGDASKDPELRKELRSTLNSYIREIDNCIALINK